jgi:hypothetical protein
VKPYINSLLLFLALLAVGNAPGGCRGNKSAGAAAPGATPGERTAMIQSGTWGGKGIVVEVTDTGATVEYDCAHGTIERLEVGRDGGFEAQGTHTPESLGPTRAGAEPVTRPARYTGRISGDTMTLTVTLADTIEKVGNFSLGRGQRTRIVKCK